MFELAAAVLDRAPGHSVAGRWQAVAAACAAHLGTEAATPRRPRRPENPGESRATVPAIAPAAVPRGKALEVATPSPATPDILDIPDIPDIPATPRVFAAPDPIGLRNANAFFAALPWTAPRLDRAGADPGAVAGVGGGAAALPQVVPPPRRETPSEGPQSVPPPARREAVPGKVPGKVDGKVPGKVPGKVDGAVTAPATVAEAVAFFRALPWNGPPAAAPTVDNTDDRSVPLRIVAGRDIAQVQPNPETSSGLNPILIATQSALDVARGRDTTEVARGVAGALNGAAPAGA
ncbi:MAG: hypothetical protein ACFCBW_20445, partial [Candidatus Competibacterales bacterium]